MPELLHEVVIDLSRVRPPATCVTFQQAQLQNLGKSYSQDGLKFSAISSGDLSIVAHPAPPNAFDWVPAQVKYLHVADSANLVVKFPKPVAWVEVSVAKVPTPASNAPSLCDIRSYVKNGLGWRSAMKRSPDIDPFGLVRSYEFTMREMVVPPYGEFEVEPEPQLLGPITTLHVAATSFDVWRICYFF